MSVRATLGYLGPEGTFTHAAALTWVEWGTPRAFSSVTEVYAAVDSGACAFGVVAIESTVEGYVVPSLDAIVAARNVVAVDEVALDITFDAFVSAGSPENDSTPSVRREISAHPHGLAQCAEFVRASGLTPVPAASNAAACRDVAPDQVALGPAICGELYGLKTLARGVQDFGGAKTRFLLLAGREAASALLGEARTAHAGDALSQWRTMIAVTPHEIGPGVLARITSTFGAAAVNMSSLITRPIKAQESTYVFIVTLDGAPWEPAVRGLLSELLDAGDSVKTLGVFPTRPMFDGAFDSTRVPQGSVSAAASPLDKARELLW